MELKSIEQQNEWHCNGEGKKGTELKRGTFQRAGWRIRFREGRKWREIVEVGEGRGGNGGR